MSSRYRNATVLAIAECGGWAGPATIAALRPRMVELRAAGLTSRAAGNVLAREYRLYSALELAEGR
jgi:hypothetical protein